MCGVWVWAQHKPMSGWFRFILLEKVLESIMEDLEDMFDQFHWFMSLPKYFASYFGILIPKTKYHFYLGYFKLISLVGSMYKLVAKVLIARLRVVMDKLNSPNQSNSLKIEWWLIELCLWMRWLLLSKYLRKLVLFQGGFWENVWFS